ncbi:MAG: TonB-dependent receptor plug domain-containing protein, partial [Candidatus Saccharicenans sp.]
RIELNGFFFNHRWEQKFIFGFEANRRRNDNPADDFHLGESEQAKYQSQFLKFDWQNNLFLSQNQTLVFGLDYKLEKGNSSYLYLSPWGNYESNFPEKRAAGMGLYLQHQARPWKELSLTSGFRYDRHQDFGSALTFRLAANFDLPGIEARLKSTLGSGFKAPSLYQLYAPADYLGPIGNQQLKPERNLGWDVGLEKTISNQFTISLTYFESHYRNLIQFYFGSGYQNLGRVVTRGLESSLEAKLLEALNLNLIWTHLKAVDQDTGTQLVRRPRDTIHLSLNYSPRAIKATLEFCYLSQRLDVDYSAVPARTVTLKSALISNIVLGYELKNHYSLFLKIDNLFHARYELVYGYGTPGTTISTGFRLKL